MTLREMLWPMQVQAVDFIVERRKVGLFDDPGSGKTLMAMTALQQLGAEEDGISLIIVPKDPAAMTWAPHYGTHSPNANIVNCYSGSREQKAARLRSLIPGTIVIANHDAIGIAKTGRETVPGLTSIKFDHVVIDEAHEVIPTATDNMAEFTMFWRGFARIRQNLREDSLILLMTGTPDRGRLQNRYGYLKAFWPTAFRHFWDWAGSNFTIEQQKIRIWNAQQGRTIERSIPVIGGILESARPRWLAMDSAYVMRRTKAEIRAGRPMKHSIPVMLQMGPQQVKALDDYDRRVHDKEVDDAPTTWAIRTRQLTGIGMWDIDETTHHAVPLEDAPSVKYEWLHEWLSERGYFDPDYVIDPEHPSKVVIAFAFTETLMWVSLQLAKAGIDLGEVGIIKGGQGSRNVTVKDTFQDHNSAMRIVLLQQQTGRGIDLDAADDLIHFDIPYDPDLTQQVEDRIDRLSRDHRTTIWWLIAKGTLDAAIALENAKRFEDTRELLDGSRGVDWHRKMIGKVTKEARHDNS